MSKLKQIRISSYIDYRKFLLKTLILFILKYKVKLVSLINIS